MDDISAQGLPVLDSITCKGNGLNSECSPLRPLASPPLSVPPKLSVTWPYQNLLTADTFSNLKFKIRFHGTMTVIIYLQKI